MFAPANHAPSPTTARAARYLKLHGVGDRSEAVGGDFFRAVAPASADCYIAKFILHDWNDADCIRIGRVMRRAMPPGSKLLVIEPALCGRKNELTAVEFLALAMAAWLPGGIERTVPELRSLLRRSGFRVTRVIETAVRIIEAVPT